MFRITLILLINSTLFSSCLTSSRIGYHQQTSNFNNTKIGGNSVLLIYSVPITDEKRQAQAMKCITQLDDQIVPRYVAVKNGLDIPAYLEPEDIHNHLSTIEQNSDFQFLMLVDGYPMPTETNGGNLVSAIIEVWEVKSKILVYNSHSTIKSKTRYTKVNDGSVGTAIFNGVVGTPIEINELLYQGIRREVSRLRVVYNKGL